MEKLRPGIKVEVEKPINNTINHSLQEEKVIKDKNILQKGDFNDIFLDKSNH